MKSGRRDSVRGKPAVSSAGLRVRELAFEILFAVERRGGYADALLGAQLPELHTVDRRLATRLVLGTLAWRDRLDYELRRFCNRDLNNIQPEALTIMRMGLLQLRFMNRVPHHAAVSTAVELAKRVRGAREAAGFINAIMRRAIREKVALPERSADEIGWLATAYSHPRWLVERFVEWFGAEDAERLMAANSEAAPNVLRLNLAKTGRDEILKHLRDEEMEVRESARFPETATLKGAPRFDSHAHQAGLFQTQSEASQIVVRMLAPVRGAVVADCAAAPGGKSAHLAELIGTRGRVIAIDLNHDGLKNARELCSRLGHRNLEFVRADVTSAIPLRDGRFDYVLLDAPCTGIGTLREHPEIRWRVHPRDIVRMSKMQSQMISQVAGLVKPGGALLYSVCSIAPAEGDGVVDEFLRAEPRFRIDSRPPAYEAIKDLLDHRGLMHTRPDIGGLDGFFAARLIREKIL